MALQNRMMNVCRLLCLFVTLLTWVVDGYAQQKLVKDIDFDQINDTVYIDVENAVIVCRLSQHQFRKINSKAIGILNEQCSVTPTKNGFEFSNNWMRAGYHSQFRYDKNLKRIRLIGMSRYEFGNAANDGSGESSVNLLTGDYIGNWNYFDHTANGGQGKLIPIPAIKTKMWFAKTYLEEFNDNIYFDFGSRCADLYQQHKDQYMKIRNDMRTKH